MPDPNTPASKLVDALREVGTLSSIGYVLEWDEQTQMPPGGAEHRAHQKAVIARLAHARLTDPALGDLLAAAEDEAAGDPPDSDRRAIVCQARRSYDRAVRLPGSLVEEFARTTALAHHGWVEARQAADVGRFVPWLEKVVGLCQAKAACLSAPGRPVYDALLDEFEPGETTAGLRDIFAALETPLTELVRAVKESGRSPRREVLTREFPVGAQEALGREAAAALGYDFDRGRLDVSVHPFSITLGPGDSRITTRYHARRFNDSFFGVLHETGHALYEQGLPPEHFGTGLGEACSMGVHESQSRLWENLVGRTPAFWQHFFPKARAMFPGVLDDVSPDEWVAALNDIGPTPIRVESDEATYNLHILLRFELEQAIVTGDLKPADVAAAWDGRLHELLGITPPDAAAGCLQDVHWAAGLFGYFPTYSLGNLIASQLFEAARRALGDLESDFARGEFGPLRDWLRRNVHRHGQRYSARELVQRATGSPLSADPLIAHLRTKAGRYFGV